MNRQLMGQIASVALGGILLAAPAVVQAEGKKKASGQCEAKSCGGSVKLGKFTSENSCGGAKACPGKDGKMGTKDDPWNKGPKACKKAGGQWAKADAAAKKAKGK